MEVKEEEEKILPLPWKSLETTAVKKRDKNVDRVKWLESILGQDTNKFTERNRIRIFLLSFSCLFLDLFSSFFFGCAASNAARVTRPE